MARTPPGNVPMVSVESTNLAQDPFLSHANFATPVAAGSPQAEVGNDPFMVRETKSNPKFKEPFEHLHAVNTDPFLTHSKGVEAAIKEQQLDNQVRGYTDFRARIGAKSKQRARLVYRFYDLTYGSIDPADITHEFLVQLQEKGVPGIVLVNVEVNVKPGSVLVEVIGDPEAIRMVKQKCPSRSVYVRNVMGVLVDPDKPDEPVPDAVDGKWAADREKPIAEEPQEPIIPYWYKAENNWLQCIQLMQMNFEQVKLNFSGDWRVRQVVAQETRQEKAQNWLHKKSGGKYGKEYKAHLRDVRYHDVFEDEHFPPDNTSWFRNGEPHPTTQLPRVAQWCRLGEYSAGCPYPEMNAASGGLQPHGGRIYQGAAEDFYLVAALQALAMKPQLIANVFCNMEYSDPSLGFFTLRFYKHGQWQYVDIDDNLPFMKDFSPLVCQSEYFPSYSWPSLIEKAYAKIHSCYEALGGGGHVEEVLTDLTGGCATRYGTRDVANDRLWMYLYEMQKQCVFGCNINEAECSKRSIPIEKHWASAIWRVLKHNNVPYVCVCTAAPSATCMHMPACSVPSVDGYGPHEGFCWLRIDDFVQLFDTIYECRLVNSDLGPPQFTGILCSPGYVPIPQPWFEELYAFQAKVDNTNAPCFIIDVQMVPNEITIECSQTDKRYADGWKDPNYDDAIYTRDHQAPLLIRFYECSPEVSPETGGEIYLVHLSAWGHTRDASTGVKVMKPGRYMAIVSVPAKYTCDRMIFRTYSLHPLRLIPVNNHRSYVAVQPARPLGAIPYCMCGFQRVENEHENLPQMFDEAEGRGKPMANPMYEGWTSGQDSTWGALARGKPGPLAFLWPFPFPTPCEMLGCGSPKGFLGTGLCRGYGHLDPLTAGMLGAYSGFGGQMPGMAGFGRMGMPGIGGIGGIGGMGGMPGMGGFGLGGFGFGGAADDGMKVVGKFGGRDAHATVEANEGHGVHGECVVM